MKAIVIVSILLLAGCDTSRNTPKQQVEDFATCKAGGMTAYLNAVGEITCYPPAAAVEPTYPGGKPCGKNKVCAGFSKRRDALACDEGRLSGSACDAWRNSSNQPAAE
jgi:hypothetical protein